MCQIYYDGPMVFFDELMEKWQTYHGLISVLDHAKTAFISIVKTAGKKTFLEK